MILGCEVARTSAATAPVASIRVTPTSLSLLVSASQGVTAKAFDDAGAEIRGQRITWTVRDPDIASVTQSGLITAIAPGVTQVSASAGGMSAVVDVDVARRPTAVVSVSPGTTVVRVGDSMPLSATALDNSGQTVAGRPVSWRSSNAAIASVSSSGVVTGVGPGSVTITATIDGVSDAASVTVQPIAVASVAVTPSTAALRLGEQSQLSVRLTDASGATLTGRVITWSSSNSSVATVSSTGLVTAAGLGSATITATSEGKSGTARVSVTLLGLGSSGSPGELRRPRQHHATHRLSPGSLRHASTAMLAAVRFGHDIPPGHSGEAATTCQSIGSSVRA